MKIIPYGRQHISSSDINAVKKTLKNNLITNGKEVFNFEKKVSNYLKCKYVSSCNSGTSALFLALLSINVKKNDKIIMPSVNFISLSSYLAPTLKILSISFFISFSK